MTELYSPLAAWYPLLLWKTPPGLELILAQEGVSFETVKEPRPFAFRTGRFVLFDSRVVALGEVCRYLTAHQVAIDIDALRDRGPVDPFAALMDDRGGLASWALDSVTVSEKVARFPKAWIRRRLIDRLRRAIQRAGGVWARLAPFPYPYRSAFGLRIDLDEPVADDFHRCADALGPLGECCTYFVSTHAYNHFASVLSELRNYDTQSHGHYHHVYRDPEANRNNVERADRILRGCGFQPHGFAAPHGRWRPSLDDALEDLGYSFSSDFQLGYDDFPFYPWKRDRFSRILQIPVHPVCEGLFLEAGLHDPQVISDYMRRVIASKIAAGDLAIVYGHPERRLGRMPEILRAISRSVENEPLVWRTTFSELARFWRWRGERRFLVLPRELDRLEIQFDEWDRRYPLALEIQRGRFRSLMPLAGPRTTLPLDDLAYERVDESEPLQPPHMIVRRRLALKHAVQVALDWETVTPLDAIPRSSLSNRVKRSLRWWKARRARVTQ
jgi:peptidoglycan/xylan/chitin deacetylase (PgdA/CDA1 family)